MSYTGRHRIVQPTEKELEQQQVLAVKANLRIIVHALDKLEKSPTVEQRCSWPTPHDFPAEWATEKQPIWACLAGTPHDFPAEWDYVVSPAGSKTCRKCGSKVFD